MRDDPKMPSLVPPPPETPHVEARRPRLAPGLVLGLILIPLGVAVASGGSFVTALTGGEPGRWVALGVALLGVGVLFRTGALEGTIQEQRRRIDGLERYIAANMYAAEWERVGVLPPSDLLRDATARAAAAHAAVRPPTGPTPPGGAQPPRGR